jgi:predicted nucleotidyltransferase
MRLKKRVENPILKQIVDEIIEEFKCHTVLLYGSHARGDATAKSDYDVMGVRKRGKKFRLAEKRNGVYLDLVVFPEDDLERVGESHLYLKGAIVLFQKRKFGDRFLRRLGVALRKPYKPLSPDEIHTRRVWAHKMFERIEQGDIEGNYRRSWLQEALLIAYFELRKKRYWGSEESFAWLKDNDRRTYNLFYKSPKCPQDLKVLQRLVERVTNLPLNHSKSHQGQEIIRPHPA